TDAHCERQWHTGRIGHASTDAVLQCPPLPGQPTGMHAMAIELDNMDHNQLDELIAQASRQKAKLQRDRRDEVKARLTRIAREEGFAIEELFGAARARSRTAGTKVAAKYRNP